MKIKMECQECEKVFSRVVKSSTAEVRCPRCKGYDVDLAEHYCLVEVTK